MDAWRCTSGAGRAEGDGPKHGAGVAGGPPSRRGRFGGTPRLAHQRGGFELKGPSRRWTLGVARVDRAEPKATTHRTGASSPHPAENSGIRARGHERERVDASLKTTRSAHLAPPREMAERVGFEPTVEFPLHTLSKRAPSTTRPSLRFRINDLRAVRGRLSHTPAASKGLSSITFRFSGLEHFDEVRRGMLCQTSQSLGIPYRAMSREATRQPKVKANVSTPASKNSTSHCRSTMGLGARTS